MRSEYRCDFARSSTTTESTKTKSLLATYEEFDEGNVYMHCTVIGHI